jgi:competence protein ComFC
VKNYLKLLDDRINYIVEELSAFISTPQCPACGEFLDNPHIHLCPECLQEFNFSGNGPVCLLCSNSDDRPCNCQDQFEYRIPELYYWGLYTAAFRALIHQFKFNHHLKLGKFLADKSIDALRSRLQELEIDLIVPVPMHGKDKSKRGYNQTEIIALAVSEKLGYPAELNILLKVKKTDFQAKLGATERWTNIADAFVVAENNTLKGKSVLLVDDIVTTGATCYYAAKALYLAGAEKITVFALVSNIREFSRLNNRHDDQNGNL